MTSTQPIDGMLIAMRRPDLDALPALVMPDGYRIRSSQPGDEQAWCAIISAAFPEEAPATLDKWRGQILEKTGYAPDRVFFVIAPDGHACATASAMQSDHADEGYLHWVAVVPAHAGKKLGLLASLHCLHQFALRGCTRAMLHTHVFRLAAITTYVKLGFVPFLTDADHQQGWRLVSERLGRALPAAITEVNA